MELPFNVTVQPAHLFAQGAVTLLHQLGVQKLVFGAEHPEMDFARLVQNRPIEVEQFKRFDQTYATAYQQHLTQKKRGLSCEDRTTFWDLLMRWLMIA